MNRGWPYESTHQAWAHREQRQPALSAMLNQDD
jgi:hypothetical protein